MTYDAYHPRTLDSVVGFQPDPTYFDKKGELIPNYDALAAKYGGYPIYSDKSGSDIKTHVEHYGTFHFPHGTPESVVQASVKKYIAEHPLEWEGSWAKALAYMAIAWLIIHLAFVALRGAIIYVAVGKFLPVRGLRGWIFFYP